MEPIASRGGGGVEEEDRRRLVCNASERAAKLVEYEGLLQSLLFGYSCVLADPWWLQACQLFDIKCV